MPIKIGTIRQIGLVLFTYVNYEFDPTVGGRERLDPACHKGVFFVNLQSKIKAPGVMVHVVNTQGAASGPDTAKFTVKAGWEYSRC